MVDLNRALSAKQGNIQTRSDQVDRLFDEIKEAKKDRDRLLSEAQKIQAKDTDRLNKAIISGSPSVVTSQGVRKLSDIDPRLEAARIDIQQGKANRAAANRVGTAVAAKAVDMAARGDSSALDSLKSGDLRGAIDAISPPTSKPNQQIQPSSLVRPASLNIQTPLGNRQTSIESQPDKSNVSGVESLTLEPVKIDPRTGKEDPGAKARNELRIKEAENRQKLNLEKDKERQKTQGAIPASLRFLEQFERSTNELETFAPGIGKEGPFGEFQRLKAKANAKFLGKLPETKAFLRELEPLANAMAREIEGGRVTDQDRAIYANAFANSLREPSKTNIRLASNSLITLADKGGNLSPIISMLTRSNTKILNDIAEQVFEKHPQFRVSVPDIQVIDINTGQTGSIPADKLNDALKSGRFRRVNG